ncbi:leucine rich repeat variant [Calothrix parasitica NIES-267]|uniref:Leucine rich repeat variant n=1 Tax=Calothrix parasitica NIES-267 TaxID=1973488 RepID=A0A1Z4LWK9_9CYAN|nr:leucine rich repeat variant [Calothrix parasitica NIES-267]
MNSKELLQPADLQPFINQPETLINQTLEIQLSVANYLQTPIELLDILVNQSCYSQVVETAKLHVTYIESTGDIKGDWREIAEEKIKNVPLQQNDRLVAELLKIAPVPEYLISEWIPGDYLIKGLENPYLLKEDKIKLLERLGKSTIIEQRLTAAAHPDTPRETLEILAGDVELPIRIAVKYRDDSFDDVIEVIESQHETASNGETLALELTELAGSKWSWIRQAVARNFNAPVEVLRELSGDEEERVQFAVAFNLATPGDVLDLLVNHYYGEITEIIAKHPNASEDGLIKLLPQHNFCIYQRPNLPASVLAELINYEEEKCDRYRRFIIENPNSPGSTLAKILESPGYKIRDVAGEKRKIASHPNILLSSLEKLAQDNSPSVRLAVYQNPKTPESLRNQLLEEFLNLDKNQFLAEEWNHKVTSEGIWKGVAESENTSASVLERLANLVDLDSETSLGENIEIAIALIGNPNTPVSTRENLIQKFKSISNSEESVFDWKIYLALALNLAIPEQEREEYFQIIVDSGDYRGIEHLAYNSKTPPHILEDIAKNEDYIHTTLYTHGFARNPSTPVDILCKLSKNESKSIREDLAKNPSTPPEIILQLAFTEESIYKPRGYNHRTRESEDWCQFWFEYPNMPIKELYQIQLSEEFEFELKQTEEFILHKINTVPQFITYIAEYGDVKHRRQLASRTNTPIHILEQLVEDDDVEVRMKLARYREHLELLLKLAKDSDVRVRKELFRLYLDTPIEVLEILKNDEAEEVRLLVARYKKTPLDILIYLSNDSSSKVKQQIAENSRIPVEILEKLWREDKIFAIKNYNTPGYIVGEKIAETYNKEVLRKILDGHFGTYHNVPASVLEELASHRENLIRCDVAEHPNTPITALEKLVNEEYCVTHWNLSSNHNTPPRLLKLIFKKWHSKNRKYDYSVLFNLSTNKNSPASILKILSNSSDSEIRVNIAANQKTPLSILKRFAMEETHESTLKYLTDNPNINREIVDLLAKSPNIQARLYAIETSHLLFKTLIQLARDESAEVREKIAKFSNINSKIYRPSPKFDDYRDIVIRIVKHPNLPLEVWQELATDSEVKVRLAVASNVTISTQIIELLVSDKSPEVRERLISQNQNISLNILEMLSRDISPNVRKAVAKHPNTSIDLLEQLALDNHQQISEAIIKNPNTTLSLKCTLQERLRVNQNPTLKGLTRLYKPDDDLPTLLSEYLQSSVPFVRFISLIHPLIPTEFLQQYSQSLLWWERYAVAMNSSTPLQILETLTEDCNCIVKAAAQDNL